LFASERTNKKKRTERAFRFVSTAWPSFDRCPLRRVPRRSTGHSFRGRRLRPRPTTPRRLGWEPRWRWCARWRASSPSSSASRSSVVT
jgi:hypothetical protein